MHEKVAEYIDKLHSPQKEIVEALRALIFELFPNMEEGFKNGVPWYEDKYYIVGLKNHVNIGFSIKGLSGEELKLFEGNGKFMRHQKVYSLDDLAAKRERIVRQLKLCEKGI